jgi:hypothetical protein
MHDCCFSQAKLAIGLLNAPAAPTANMKKVAAEITPSPENDAWLVSVVEPTTLPNVRAAIPELSLLLEHVYGYESQTMRNNVRYTGDDEIVYTVSTMGIVLNTTNKAQRIYKVFIIGLKIQCVLRPLFTVYFSLYRSFTRMRSPLSPAPGTARWW